MNKGDEVDPNPFCSIRLVFAIYAKKLADLLNRLYYYPIKNQIGIWKTAWHKARLVINLSAALALISSVIFTVAYNRRQTPSSENLSLFFWAGQIGSVIIGIFFGSLCTTAATNIAFSLIVSISLYLGMIFAEFCDDLEDLLTTSGMWIFRDFNTEKIQKNGSITVQISSSRDILLKKLENMQDIFKTADQIISPLVLIVFVVETFRMVTGAHELIINKLGELFAVQGHITIVEQLVHTSLVLVGQHVKDMINLRKKQLQSLLMLRPETSCNQEAVDVAKWMISFNWKLSASGFFEVDRKLLSGIMATAMTYIVILVQLQISLNATNHSSNLDNYNNTSTTASEII